MYNPRHFNYPEAVQFFDGRQYWIDRFDDSHEECRSTRPFNSIPMWDISDVNRRRKRMGIMDFWGKWDDSGVWYTWSQESETWEIEEF